jgi:hypothetical protein
MRVRTATWDQSGGWSGELPPWDGPGTLVVAFGASDLLGSPGPLRELVAAYPSSVVMGCSTAGEINGDAVYQDSLTVAVARFETTRLHVAHERVADPDQSYDAGVAVAKRLHAADPEIRALFVLSDGLQVNGTSLVDGLVAGTEGRVLITGGLAGDGERFQRTWTLVDGEPRGAHVSAVAFAGPDVRVGHGSQGGWDIFGPERLITRAEDNVLYELDGQPALGLYKKYLGERAAGLPATAHLFPLAVRVPGNDERQLVRTVISLDESTQSMTFAGDIPEGSLAQLMRANLDRIIDGAHVAAVDTGTEAGSGALALAVSCVGRRLLLGRRTEDELDAARSGLPPDAALVGFYSYGEVFSVVAGICDLYNQTMTVTSVWESTSGDG